MVKGPRSFQISLRGNPLQGDLCWLLRETKDFQDRSFLNGRQCEGNLCPIINIQF